MGSNPKPEVLIQAADLCSALAWDDRCVDYLTRYIALAPGDDEARFNLGVTLLKTQDHLGAIKVFDSLRSSGYRVGGCDYYYGVALINEERFKEALDHLIEAKVEGLLKANRLFNIAECLRRLGKDEEARRFFLDVLRVQPDNRPAQLRLQMIGD